MFVIRIIGTLLKARYGSTVDESRNEFTHKNWQSCIHAQSFACTFLNALKRLECSKRVGHYANFSGQLCLLSQVCPRGSNLAFDKSKLQSSGELFINRRHIF